MEQKELQELFRLIRLEFYWMREEGKLGLYRLEAKGLRKDEMEMIHFFALDQAIQKLEESILPDLKKYRKKIEKVVEEKDQ